MRTTIIILALSLGILPGLIAGIQQGAASRLNNVKIDLIMDHVQSKPKMEDVKKTEIKSTELMKAIQDDLATQFKGWTVTSAHKVDKKGLITYEVMIKKDNTEKGLVYDSNGKYLNEIPLEKMHPSSK